MPSLSAVGEFDSAQKWLLWRPGRDQFRFLSGEILSAVDALLSVFVCLFCSSLMKHNHGISHISIFSIQSHWTDELQIWTKLRVTLTSNIDGQKTEAFSRLLKIKNLRLFIMTLIWKYHVMFWSHVYLKCRMSRLFFLLPQDHLLFNEYKGMDNGSSFLVCFFNLENNESCCEQLSQECFWPYTCFVLWKYLLSNKTIHFYSALEFFCISVAWIREFRHFFRHLVEKWIKVSHI